MLTKQTPVDLADAIGQGIRQARRELGWNQERLAAECGVSSRTISHIETGRSNPRMTTLCMIAETLGTSLSLIISEGEELLS